MHDMGDRLFAAFERLDLSDAQKEKLRQIRRSAPASLMPKRQALMEARMDLSDLMDKEGVDTAAARKAHEKVLQARDALEVAQFDLRFQARDVLTPDQRKQLRKDLHPGAAWERGGAHGMDDLDGMEE
jgi:Spy/CpxP family protein refolding chaperone